MKTLDQTTHTPGPWMVRPIIDFDGDWEARITKAGEAIGSLTQAGSRDRREAEANARLIAAAPDLMAVCVAIEAYAAPLGAGLLAQLRAAIAATR